MQDQRIRVRNERFKHRAINLSFPLEGSNIYDGRQKSHLLRKNSTLLRTLSVGIVESC